MPLTIIPIPVKLWKVFKYPILQLPNQLQKFSLWPYVSREGPHGQGVEPYVRACKNLAPDLGGINFRLAKVILM
jgi:hypothetical protein